MSDLAISATDQVFDTAIAHLRSLSRTAFLRYAITVGDYLVHHFFAGNYAALHDQDPNKAASLHAFLRERRAELAELDLSATTLRRYMAAAESWQALPDASREHLGLHQLQSLAAVGDPQERRQLAHQASVQHWSKEKTAAAVQDYKKRLRGGQNRGRKPLPVVLKDAHALQGAAERLVRLHGAAQTLDAGHRQRFLAALDAVHAAVAHLRG